MQNTCTCRTCDRPINRGSTAGTGHNGICTVCQVARALEDLPHWRTPAPKYRQGVCACGCGRAGAIVGRGMVGVCYQRAYHARRRG